jgi:precorrin-3B C17-methyltransferase
MLYLVGIGPGDARHMTGAALAAVRASDVVVGYTTYVAHIGDMLKGKEVITSGMRQEVERCRRAIELARSGKHVALISSGDPGVYGMAGPALEILDREGGDLPVEVIPGVPAANSAAALMGAPLMVDYATISLSDLLVPWETIKKRLEASASADMVTVLYNPKSVKRDYQIEEARRIFLRYREPETPVGIATGVSGEDEEVILSDLARFTENDITMRSLVIIGNSTTVIMGNRLVTPRGYQL